MKAKNLAEFIEATGYFHRKTGDQFMKDAHDFAVELMEWRLGVREIKHLHPADVMTIEVGGGHPPRFAGGDDDGSQP